MNCTKCNNVNVVWEYPTIGFVFCRDCLISYRKYRVKVRKDYILFAEPLKTKMIMTNFCEDSKK
jgi:hypothetical protein